MGTLYKAECKKCSHTFSIPIGFGFAGAILLCDRCGKKNSVGIRDHLKDREEDERLEDKIEENIDRCGCGGSFRFDAPASCPKCSSFDLKMQAEWGLWD